MLYLPINKLNGIEKFYNDPLTLLSDLNDLEKNGYFLRGVESRDFHAKPSAFRSNKIEKNRSFFPINYEKIVSEWFYDLEIIKIIQDDLKIDYFEIRNNPMIHRLFNLISYLMVCNYLFSKYKEGNTLHIFPHDYQQLKNKGSDFWSYKQTFNNMVQYYFPLILTREALDKSWTKKGKIDEIISAIDMSFPQHYGTSTAALDFTKKYLNAVYFAIESHLNINFENKIGLYLTEKDVFYDGYLSIYAIKLISPSKNSPITIEEIDNSILNRRATNQQGVLCYFSRPCSFYMDYDRFPKIEDYLVHGKNDFFILKKLSLKRSIKNLDLLEKILIKENIVKDFIYPD